MLALAVFCALTIDIAGITRSVVKSDHYVGDFTVFWTAARSSPDIIYDTDAISHAQAPLIGGDKGPRPFLNPPSFLPWLAPFARLPFLAALAVWNGLGLLALGLAAKRLLSWREIAIAAVAPPLVLAFAAGQVTLFVSAVSIAALLNLRTRPLLAGALLGLAATIKPQAVLLAPLALMAGRHWRALAAAAIVGAAIGAACVALQGPSLWLSWFRALSGFGEISQRFYLMRRGATPANLAYLMSLSGPAKTALVTGGAVLGLVLVWVTFRGTQDVKLRLGALVAGSILCLTYAMPYEAAPLLIPATGMLLDPRRPLLWFVGFLMISQLILPIAVIAMAAAILWLVLKDQSPRVAEGSAPRS